MNNNINLTKILKDCPCGWKFWSPIFGEVIFTINQESLGCVNISIENGDIWSFNADATLTIGNIKSVEIMLYPSREQRDWNKFTAPWYKNEQKSTDKIEPRFKVGDWVVNKFGDSWHIDSLDKKNYQVFNVKGNYNYFPISKQEEMHLWTIQDAKDGDFLCCKSGWMCIFKSLNNYTNTFSSYCFMDSNKCFFNSGGECHPLDKEFINAYNGEIHPATKEQRDLLFQKIKEAGYKWNDKTKTLEKLIKPKFKVGDIIRHKESNKDDVYRISIIYDDSYGIAGFTWGIYMKYQDQYELVNNKFDPKTLKPFDKVLVKNDDDITWVAALFSHIIEFHDEVTGNDYLESVTSYCTSSFCIPYNDDTKHLVGTTEEASEFYKYWED